MTTLRRVETPADRAAFAALVREYVASLPFLLDFQDVDQELEALDEEYGPPAGAAILAVVGDEPVGCVALRGFEPPVVAELKRMYVRPQARGAGAGRALASAALEAARRLGYSSVRLDTAVELVEAARIYTKLGFVEIAPYRHNPLPSARFYEVTLTQEDTGLEV
jgi:putative acetyltransferase